MSRERNLQKQERELIDVQEKEYAALTAEKLERERVAAIAAEEAKQQLRLEDNVRARTQLEVCPRQSWVAAPLNCVRCRASVLRLPSPTPTATLTSYIAHASYASPRLERQAWWVAVCAGANAGARGAATVSYTHLTLPTTPYV